MAGFTDMIPGFNTEALMGGVSGFVQLIIYITVAALVCAILYGCFYLLSFNTIVTIRQKTNSGSVVLVTKSRTFRNKDGVTKWRLLKWIKEVHTPPKTDYLELTTKGKFIAFGDRDMNGTINWRKVSDSPENPDTFSSEEKAIQVIENRRAEDYKKVKTIDKLLAQAPILMCIIILVVVFAFWGDIATKSTAALQAIKPNMDQITESNNRLAQALETYYKIHGYDVNGTYQGDVPPPNSNPTVGQTPN